MREGEGSNQHGARVVVAVAGPTAVGKSLLAERIAGRLDGEIVSVDSMQVYRHMDIGTAKTPPAARTVPHHCIDLVDPGVPFSAALYQRAARDAIAAILRSARTPILVGGTGLYIRAALDDWTFPAGEPASPLRERLESEAAALGPDAMHALLAERDPASAALIHPSNVRRTIRALEMAETGSSYALQARSFATRHAIYDVRFIGLTMDRELLYERIDRRVDAMIEAGLLDEVGCLLAAGFRDALTARQAIGYKELVPVIEEGADLGEAIAAIKQSTRRYAKRQMTWFRGEKRIRWIDATEAVDEQLLSSALRLIESTSPANGAIPAPGSWRLAPPCT